MKNQIGKVNTQPNFKTNKIRNALKSNIVFKREVRTVSSEKVISGQIPFYHRRPERHSKRDGIDVGFGGEKIESREKARQ